MKRKVWGQTMSIDLSGCDYNLLTNPQKLKEFAKKLCREIKMIPHGKPIIQRFGVGELEGWSLMQFIETSTITVHLDEFDLRAFIDIFTCKRFQVNKAKNFCKSFFNAKKIRYRNFYRY